MADFHNAATACKQAITQQHTMVGLELGGDGSNIANPLDVTTFTWMASQDKSKILMLGEFAMAIRTERFLGEKYNTLAEGTVRSTIFHVVQTFREKSRPNPTKDADHEVGILLSR
jgi:hypothetical protein